MKCNRGGTSVRSRYQFRRVTMFRLRLLGAAFAALTFVSCDLRAADREVRFPGQHRAFLQSYCVHCHDDQTQEGRVRLDDIGFGIRDAPTAERWQKVLGAVNSGDMPPDGEDQPQNREKAAFLEDLSEAMVAARRMLSDSGGVTTLRRLNRREYVNTMRELLGVQIEARELPDDANPGGFDTAGGSLFFSSDQFEQYLDVARAALDQAIVGGERPSTKSHRVEAEKGANGRVRQVLRGYQMGGYRKYKLWKASNGRPPSDFGLVDEREMEFRKLVWDREAPSYIDYLTRKETRDGALLTMSSPNPQVGIAIPDVMPPGQYRIRARIGVVGKPDPSSTFVEFGTRGETIESAIALIGCRRVHRPMRAPEVIEFDITLPPLSKPLNVDVGGQTNKRVTLGERVYVVRQRAPNSRDATRYQRMESIRNTGFNLEPALWVDWMEWEGPLVQQWPPKSHVRLLSGAKGDADAEKVVARFAERAFRGRPLRPQYLKRLMRHYRMQRNAGESFEEAIKTPLSIVLSSPSFLYLTEPVEVAADAESGRSDSVVPTGVVTAKITPRQLACRLSYFLWSGPPDSGLLKLAANGTLARPDVLAAQVDRMLKDARAHEFVSGFAHQWLDMERLDFFQFNYRLYPEFDDSVKEAARQEVYQTILSLIRRDRSVSELLRSDTIVINDLLADFYGIDEVRGPHFREVNVPDGVPRGGLLGMAAVLAMGSDGQRSSLVERGAWVMRKLLHDPPPPAPANVPQLSRHAGKLLGARELLTAHMEEPQCAQCHQKIDPVGYGLEQFDAVGRWRRTEYAEVAKKNRVIRSKELPIDAGGQLPDGSSFDGFFQFRDAVAGHEEAFARGLIEELIEYSLGRPFGFSDEQLASSVLASAKENRLTIRSMIQAIVSSEPFQTRKTQTKKTPE